ncbi:MAG: glycosyl hydrolase-related protein [Bryobacteraceae bacterium]
MTIRIPVLILALYSLGYAKDWKVFCLPEKHLDVGWSHLPADALDQGYPGSVEEFQNFSLARAIFIRDHTSQYPPDARYRWFVDSAWQIEQLQKYNPRLIPKLRQLINDGEFSYNPMYANLHTMTLGHEQLMRTMAYGRVLENNGFRRSYMANASDAFSVGWGYASMLASAGIKYFIKGTWFTGPSVTPGITDGMVQPAPLFRWVGPDGKKVLFFYYRGYHDMGGNFGEPMSEVSVRTAVDKYEKLSREGKWPYDAFPLFGSEADWGIPDIDDSNFIREWNKSNPSIRLKMATPEEFFEYIEANFADKIPDGVTGGWGVSHDIEENTFAKPGARARANDHALLAAEAFGALAGLRLGVPYDADEMRRAWLKQVVYHEHSFGYLNTGPSPESLRQYAWKNRLTEQVRDIADASLGPALRALAAQIPNGGENRIAVFNSLGFEQTGFVDLPLTSSQTGRSRVIDVESGRPAASQVWEAGGKKLLRFRASSVPAIGYRSFRIEAAGEEPATAKVSADAARRTIENQFYRVMLSEDGSIASLFDKDLKAEIFEAPGAMLGNQFIFKDDTWRDHSPRSATITVENAGELCSTLRSESARVSIFPRNTRRYTLCDGEKRLEIANSFTKEPGTSNSAETIFYAFPIAVPGGIFHIDIPGVVARYPDEFRQETHWTYMPAQSFVSVSNNRMNVVLATREAPNFSFRTMRKYFEHLPLPETPATRIFAMPLSKQTVNKHDYDQQGGTYEFHYALTSSQGPLKPADDGRGLIVRLWNPGHQAAPARLVLADIGIAAGVRTDVLERDTGGEYPIVGGALTVPVGAREFVTVRIQPGKAR